MAEFESWVLQLLETDVSGPSMLEDFRNSKQTPLVVGSFVLYTISYNIVYALLSTWGHFKSIGKNEQLDWATRIISDVNAVISVVGSIVLFRHEPGIWKSLVEGQARCEPLFCVFLGYMLYDFSVIVINVRVMDNVTGHIVHHFVSLTTCIVALWCKVFYLFGVFFLLTELSTPFINNHWFIKNMKWRESLLYYMNGLLGMALFFAVRIAGQIYLLFYLYHMWNDMMTIAWYISGFFVSCLIVIISLNCFWFWKMVSIVFRTFSPPKSKKN